MIVALLAHSALAFDWEYVPPGTVISHSGTYHIEPSSFSSAEITEIVQGAQAWDAGAGEAMRGADWHWIRDTDVSSANWFNARDEVYERNQTWFENHFIGGFIAYALPGVPGEVDIIFNSSTTWCTDAPSGCTSGVSIGQTAAHEFGHRIGANHEDDDIATMNSIFPNGGDIGGAEYRVNEDDFVGLMVNKGDSSTGKDLMLSKFEYLTNGRSDEVWETSTIGNWRVHQNGAWISNSPEDILAIIEGTSTQSPLVEWRLSPDATCFSGTEYIIGSRTPTLSPNVPYAIDPNGWGPFTSVPVGTYYLCAMIDPYDTINESSEGTENDIRSERLFQVEP